MHDFIHTHIEEFAQLHPRPAPLETPIENPKKTTSQYGWVHTEIKPIDNVNN
jgi:hypothetical protein